MLRTVKRRSRKDSHFINGVPELLILRLLSEGEMYGYQIAQAIQDRTGDLLAFGEGCIYPILRSLLDERILASRRQRVDGRTRLYYTLSEKGHRRLDALSAEWQRVSRGVSMALGSVTAE